MMKPSDIFASFTASPFRAIGYALVFCLSLPLLFILLGDEDPFLHNLAFSLSITLLAQLSITISIKFFHHYSAWIQWSAVIFSLLLALTLGARLAFWITGADRDLPDDMLYISIFASVPFGLLFFGVILWVFYSRAKVAKAEAQSLELQLHYEMNEKQLSQAQLNLLQAQIEPHFLFNTLATVHSLIEQSPRQASSMLERTNDYLRSALDHSRSKDCLLSHEINLLQSYLDIMKMRMGNRLHFEVLVDNRLLNLPFPPMLLQPLVENAIKHGLEPKLKGGMLQISGMIKDKKLCIDIIDSGVGFDSFKGEGIGLSNVRERLKTVYGDEAQFEIIALGHRGVRSSLQVPIGKV